MALRLSVVVVGSRPQGSPEALFRSLDALLRRGDAELLLVTARPEPPPAWPGTRVIACGAGTTIPAMRLAGIEEAAGTLIAITEDFCAPVAGWAEALLEAHERVAAAALGGPVTRRIGSAAEWALTFIEYGRYFRREPEGDVADLPSINVAYDAERLRAALPAGAQGLFEVEVHARLRARGGRFWRVPGAVMCDENRTVLRSAMHAQYHHGRLFGGGRVQGRSLLVRFARVGLAPAVPAILLGRILRETGSAGQLGKVVRCLPALLLLLGAWAAGEAVGSLYGPGRSGARWT